MDDQQQDKPSPNPTLRAALLLLVQQVHAHHPEGLPAGLKAAVEQADRVLRSS